MTPSADTVLSLYHSGALICAAIVAVYLLLRWATGHVPWLKEPHHAHYATALLAALGVFVGPAAAGAKPTLSMLLTAIGTLVALVLPGLASKPPAEKQTGFARLSLLAVLALVAVVISAVSCGAQQKAALKDLATCAETTAVKDLTPTAESILLAAATGTITKASAEAQLKALGGTFGLDELACAVRAAQAFFASKQGGVTGSADAARLAEEWLVGHGYDAATR